MGKKAKTQNGFKVGVCKDIITPPVGTPLAGYAFEKVPSIGIHDELYVRAMVLQQAHRKVALAMLDVIGFDGLLINKVKDIVTGRTDITAESIIVGATHTHAGPVGLYGFNEYKGVLSVVIGPYAGDKPDDSLLDITARKVAGTIIQASEKSVSARVGTAVGTIDEIGRNRRDPDYAYDGDDAVTLFEGPEGPVSILYSYACHPTVLHQDNRYISADFPGFSNEQLERMTGALPLYMTGAAGDISTRHTRRGKTFEEVRRFGSILCGETVKTVGRIAAEEVSELKIVREAVRLPVKNMPSSEAAREYLRSSTDRLEKLRAENTAASEIKHAETLVEGANIVLDLHEKSRIRDLRNVEIELVLLKIGHTAILFIPGEMFVEIGKMIKAHAQSMGFTLHICCYANGYLGYIPTAAAFNVFDYESWASIVGSETASIIAASAERLIAV